MFAMQASDRLSNEAALWRRRQAIGKRSFVLFQTMIFGNGLFAILTLLSQLPAAQRTSLRSHQSFVIAIAAWALCLAIGLACAHGLWRRGMRLIPKYPDAAP